MICKELCELYLYKVVIFRCYKVWEQYLLLEKDHPCSDKLKAENFECCIWGEIFSKNLTAVMMVMKEALHR